MCPRNNHFVFPSLLIINTSHGLATMTVNDKSCTGIAAFKLQFMRRTRHSIF